MEIIALPGPVPTVVQLPDRLRIMIPARRSGLAWFGLGAWLVGGAALVRGAAPVLRAVPRTELGLGDLLFLGIVALLVSGWLTFGYLALWLFLGRERVDVTREHLQLRRGWLGRGPPASYVLGRVRRLRVAPQVYTPGLARGTRDVVGLEGGTIAFDYDGQEVRFGGALESEVAHAVVEHLRAAAPLALAASVV